MEIINRKKTQKSQKNKVLYECINCNYNTSNKTDYNKHLSTPKHINNENKRATEINGNEEDIVLICSECNKKFVSNSGLWKHRKKCIDPSPKEPEEPLENTPLENTFRPVNTICNFTPELFFEVLKQSKELQEVLIQQNKELQNQVLEQQNKLLEKESELQNKLLEKETELHNKLLEQNEEHHKQIIELASKPSMVNSNNNNKTNFNLQFFLNETCKDAMNITDFINSIKLTTDDFETTGRLGFVDGISRIFVKELKKLTTEKLPLHCTDYKRETVYIKNNDIWEKENDEKTRVKWAINRVAQLNLNQVAQWQEKYPECVHNNTRENEKFTELALVALGGRGKEQEDKFREKIMKNVLKEVVLDKK